jgi:uncharacterized protein (DUF2147 family)
MKRLFALAAILAFPIPGAFAAEPSVIGDWLVKDGYANIRIDICAGKLWGIVVWEKEPGVDSENPDPTKKTRPTLGMPVLMGLAPTKPNRWEGEIYNSQNGKMYTANITMADENTLDLEGCLVWPLCLTQKWTRVKTLPANALPLPPLSAPTKSAPVKGTKSVPAPAAQSDVCVRVAEQTAPANSPAKQIAPPSGVAKQTK